jgi:hypothetical protein
VNERRELPGPNDWHVVPAAGGFRVDYEGSAREDLIADLLKIAIRTLATMKFSEPQRSAT